MTAEESMIVKFTFMMAKKYKQFENEYLKEAEVYIAKYTRTQFDKIAIDFFSGKQINDEFYQHYKTKAYDLINSAKNIESEEKKKK